MAPRTGRQVLPTWMLRCTRRLFPLSPPFPSRHHPPAPRPSRVPRPLSFDRVPLSRRNRDGTVRTVNDRLAVASHERDRLSLSLSLFFSRRPTAYTRGGRCFKRFSRGWIPRTAYTCPPVGPPPSRQRGTSYFRRFYFSAFFIAASGTLWQCDRQSFFPLSRALGLRRVLQWRAPLAVRHFTLETPPRYFRAFTETNYNGISAATSPRYRRPIVKRLEVLK